MICLNSKREEEDETTKESKLYIYDETHLLTYLENIKSISMRFLDQLQASKVFQHNQEDDIENRINTSNLDEKDDASSIKSLHCVPERILRQIG